MNIQKVIEELGAEMTSNRAMARVDGARVIVARYVDNELVLTEQGEELAKLLEPAPKKPKASAKKSAPAEE